MRYHQRRRGFFDSGHKIAMFLIIAFGSAAFADITIYFAGLAAAVAAGNLVWNPSHRARDHEILFRRFSDLATRVRTSEPTHANFNGWLGERITIETEEPPIYKALEADCDNEVRRAWGRDSQPVQIGWWARVTMNLLRHDQKSFAQQPAHTQPV